MKPYAILPLVLALCSCRAENSFSTGPLAGYWMSQSNSIPSLVGVHYDGGRDYPLTNWLTVTSSTSPRVITAILKEPRKSIAASGQVWVSAAQSFINTPDVTDWPGETNKLYTLYPHITTNHWPMISQSISLIYVREIQKADAGRVAGLDYYARCRVRLWTDSAFVESEATLLLSSLTNNCTLVTSESSALAPPKP